MSEFAGHLELTCASDADGRSFLRRQSFRAPFHISKSYRGPHALAVQVINPTAGLFAGDKLNSKVQVEAGGRLLLTTPSAARAHAMPSGHAELHQSFHVQRGAWLEYTPAALIPQAGCSYRQQTQIDLDAGAELFFVETITPGRVARGEIWACAELEWKFDLRVAGNLTLRERFTLREGDGSSSALTTAFAQGYYASGVLISTRLAADDPCWEGIRRLNTSEVLLGASQFVPGGWGIKILARDGVALRRALQELRRLLAEKIEPLRAEIRDGR